MKKVSNAVVNCIKSGCFGREPRRERELQMAPRRARGLRIVLKVVVFQERSAVISTTSISTSTSISTTNTSTIVY